MKIIRNCPACSAATKVSELTCTGCGLTMQGNFDTDPFLHLSGEEVDFALVFIKNRGNIKEVERELNISYPTVRARLNTLIAALGFSSEESEEDAGTNPRMEIITRMEREEISPSEAAKLLKNL